MSHNYKKFDMNKAQRSALQSVKRAFQKAQAAGIVFYAKSDSLVAYTKECDKYSDEEFSTFEKSLASGAPQLPYVSMGGIIVDSGADDYPCFKNNEDYQDYLESLD